MNKKNPNDLNERRKQIFEFIKKHPFCSKDKIFRVGKIPKSSATNNLIETLVSRKKVKTIHNENGKIRYYIHPVESFADWVKWAELSIKQAEYFSKEMSPTYSELRKKIWEFFKIRLRVLKVEGKNSETPRLNFRDTTDMMNWILEFQKNPSPLFEFVLMDMLRFAIKDDKYYLKHQLHSKPRENEYSFQKEKRHLRRSVSDLLAMKERGRHEFSLSRADFMKNMKKITDDPHNWLDRFFAENDRSLYQNDPNLKKEISKKIESKYLKTLKLGIPKWKEKKKLLLAERILYSKNRPDKVSLKKLLQAIWNLMTDEEKSEWKNLSDKLHLELPFPV